MSHKTVLSVVAAIGLFSSATALAGFAEEAFSAELQQCAAYYQISSEAIAAMNAPQMAAVGDRLKQSAKDAEALAAQYSSAQDAEKGVAAARAEMLETMGNSKSLGGLMSQYKDSCKTILAEPQKRLDYWIMANM
ncbi:hypothetical protein [Shewanella algae]|uniref:hypothetical protein n=1 Tax=Shewanella algae TaxID=38313 RepID=UPI000C34321B|nr:hypothetical protein [Shewanella algae]MBO2641893.1 hypothetical protein [Shewanella algae]